MSAGASARTPGSPPAAGLEPRWPSSHTPQATQARPYSPYSSAAARLCKVVCEPHGQRDVPFNSKVHLKRHLRRRQQARLAVLRSRARRAGGLEAARCANAGRRRRDAGASASIADQSAGPPHQQPLCVSAPGRLPPPSWPPGCIPAARAETPPAARAASAPRCAAAACACGPWPASRRRLVGRREGGRGSLRGAEGARTAAPLARLHAAPRSTTARHITTHLRAPPRQSSPAWSTARGAAPAAARGWAAGWPPGAAAK